uniref:AlNc14C722G12447 protein n=1 Tax=Albugo laibachii Nc14 TaxID=890382 RepID=F0X1X0_9STRA|nr:AlNc14C722G12447 [Albugo laibachii Nc14]|eukprot:CCA27827.1 AlNc14C722G12447 [Albugo laibachii Nc14]
MVGIAGQSLAPPATICIAFKDSRADIMSEILRKSLSDIGIIPPLKPKCSMQTYLSKIGEFDVGFRWILYQAVLEGIILFGCSVVSKVYRTGFESFDVSCRAPYNKESEGA